jgi:excisionase family DNA binding protein
MQGQSMHMSRTSKQALTPLLIPGREAAKLLSVCERTLYTLTRTGEIPAVRIGRAVRYSVDDLQAWVRRASEKKCENNENGT